MCGFGLSQRVSFGASGWHTEAPTLYHYLYHTFFPHGLYPRVGNGGGKRWDVTPGHHTDDGGNRVKRVRPTRKTRPVAQVSHDPRPRASNDEEMEKIAPSLPPKERG